MNKQASTITPVADNQISELSPELQRGPAWLRRRRQQSRQAFNETPLPRRGLHLWRYTDPSRFLFERDAVADTAYGENYDAVEKLLVKQLQDGRLSGLVTDLGGREITIHGADALQSRGVVVMRLSEAVETHGELVERHLYQLVDGSSGKFEAQNGALWNDGVFVYVPDGVSVTEPLQLLRESGLAGSAQFPRTLIVVGNKAELTVIDEYAGGSAEADSGPSHANGVIEIFGGQASNVRYVFLQRQASHARFYHTHRARIEGDATMLTIPLAFGAALSKDDFGVTLAGENAESRMYGLLFGAADQHFDNHTRHHHVARHTSSNIDFKVVLKDRALSAYTGLIRIENEARTCEAYQENRNLLLNDGTKAETIPELEILNEDVRCTHGATIGPIDPMSIFYLGSRGIPPADAVKIITTGFIQSTLKPLPQDLQERIAGFVAQRLESI